ncbi:MAG: hypothetical protein AAB897_01165 [Patescibacteria group bacterium]
MSKHLNEKIASESVERTKRSFEEIFVDEEGVVIKPIPENHEKVLKKLHNLGKVYEKNPSVETYGDYHDALDAAKAAGFEDLPKSTMYAAYDAQKTSMNSPAGTPEKHQR